jgi:hypothetical protein
VPARPPVPAQSLAVALADAFLAGEWNRAELVVQGAEILADTPRWLGRLVSTMQNAYERAPRDRPRELANFLLGLDVFQQNVGHVRIRQRPVRPTKTVQSRWNGPRIDDLGVLARWLEVTDDHLDWFADRRGLNRHARDSRLHHYVYRWLPGRLIEAPKPRLRELQRRILAEVLGPVPVHGSVHGFVPGRGPHTFAAVHTGQRTVIRVDLTCFFASVAAPRVYGLFRTMGHPEPVAHTLAALCTARTPAAVLRAAPSTLVDRTFRIARLRGPHLPQGAPTSPALANLCAYRLDRRLSGLAAAFGARYARYADDLAFSGDLSLARAGALAARVESIVADEGFRVHRAKTRVRGRGDRQTLAGLVVNEHPAVPRTEYDRLRAVLHDAVRNGLDVANRGRRPDFPAYLAGRVAWVGHRHPARAAKLSAMLWAALASPAVDEPPDLHPPQ